MSQPQQLFNRLQVVLLNHNMNTGSNIKDQLASITWHEAIIQIDFVSSIADILNQMNQYLQRALNYLNSNNLESLKTSDFSASKIKAKYDWDHLQHQYYDTSKAIVRHIKHMESNDLLKASIDKTHLDHQNYINGIIEYCYYQLGQIVLIKKMIKGRY